jgi:5-methylcytosine-specific restriction endonuclease McrA
MGYKNPDQQREYNRLWVAKRRADWLAENGPCKNCGSWESLEVDHIDRTQKISHSVWSWSEARRLAELAKCQVLCHDCHLEKGREAGDLGAGPRVRTTRHGSQRMYTFQKCRCDECRAWKQRDNAKTIERRRQGSRV